MSDSDRHPFQRFDDVDVESYDSGFEMARQAAIKLIEVASPAPDARILDVACGTGFATFLALDAIGSDGFVLATDISSHMLDVARKRAERESLANVEFRLTDGANLGVPPGSFDLITCASALFAFPDIGAALSNWREALRSRGTIAFTSFTGKTPGPYGWPELNTVLDRHLGADGRIPRPDRLQTERACRTAVAEAGYVNIICEQHDCGYHYADAEAIWREMVGSLFSLRLSALGEDDIDRLKQDIMIAVGPRFEDGPVYRSNDVIVTTATNP